MEQIDMKCAACGYAIVEACKDDAETIITKSLGVLQEDGVYAFFLYLDSKKKDGNAKQIFDKATDLLRKDALLSTTMTERETDILKVIREKLAIKLDMLLYAKEILDRTLVYARYHAKALNIEPGIGGE